MNNEEKYFDLCYLKRIHEFSKIELIKVLKHGEAQNIYKTIDGFYRQELNIDQETLIQLRNKFKRFNELFSKYFNDQRQELFENHNRFFQWYNSQNDSCNYCGITQKELLAIVVKRDGNLTLNKKTKRSKGSLEIEKLDPAKGYTFENSVLACPFCNNAKSNLIEEEDWRKFFVPAMKDYINSIMLK